MTDERYGFGPALRIVDRSAGQERSPHALGRREVCGQFGARSSRSSRSQPAGAVISARSSSTKASVRSIFGRSIRHFRNSNVGPPADA
jgi:hypothetical protein